MFSFSLLSQHERAPAQQLHIIHPRYCQKLKSRLLKMCFSRPIAHNFIAALPQRRRLWFHISILMLKQFVFA